MKNKSLIATRHAKRVAKTKTKKNWSLSNKEILHQRLLRRFLIRTLDFGIDFTIWSNLEDNYHCDTREKIGHAGGEIGEKNVTQENGKSGNWIPILPSTYKNKGSNSLQTNVREKGKNLESKLKLREINWKLDQVLLSWISLKKNLFSIMNSHLGSILLGTYNG